VVSLVSHYSVPIRIHCDSLWAVELSQGESIPVPMAVPATARKSGHLALLCDHADAIVERVSHNDVAAPIHCDSTRKVNSTRKVELTKDPFSVSMALLVGARQSGHMALWCDLADAMVTPNLVSHNDVAIPIHCDFSGTVELSKRSLLRLYIPLRQCPPEWTRRLAV
jgi:hypothetical protein